MHINNICSIYIIKNKINNKPYCGQTWCGTETRFNRHIKEAKYGSNDCPRLYNAIRKYGEINFYIEFIGQCYDQKTADCLEDSVIEIYDSIKNGYNLRGGGSRGKYSDEEKQKRSGENNPMFGRHHTDETKKRISESRKGKRKGYKNTEETKKKMSDAKRGKCRPKEMIDKISGENHYMFGKHLTAETKKKISETKKKRKEAGYGGPMLGKHHTEETKKKISDMHKGENGPRAKLTWEIVNKIRKEYIPYKVTQKELSEKYKVSKITITRIVNHKCWKE